MDTSIPQIRLDPAQWSNIQDHKKVSFSEKDGYYTLVF